MFKIIFLSALALFLAAVPAYAAAQVVTLDQGLSHLAPALMQQAVTYQGFPRDGASDLTNLWDLPDIITWDHWDQWDDWDPWLKSMVEGGDNHAEIRTDPVPAGQYGMNCHNLDSMSQDDFERMLRYAGPWVRINISTDEAAEGNWSWRLEPGLDKLRRAGESTGIAPKVVVSLSGYSNHSSGDLRLLSSLNWDAKASRFQELAFRLTQQVRSLGFGDAVIESWNEPDHPNLGIGLDPGSGAFVEALASMNRAFANGVHQAGGRAAFSPFMTLNESKFSAVKNVWGQVSGDFDFFTAHHYDDDPAQTFYWSWRTRDEISGDKPVLISEHGYQHYKKNTSLYRFQARAVIDGFARDRCTTVWGVMNYVYASSHGGWNIGGDEDFFWKVSHNDRP